MNKILLILLFPLTLFGQNNFFWSHGSMGDGCVEYGYLYNKAAVTDSRNIANTGYRVATADDWNQLITLTGDYDAAKLKESGYWESPYVATNEFMFNARGGGFRGESGTYNLFGTVGLWHSSDASTLRMEANTTSIAFFTVPEKTGASVRIVKLSTNLADGEMGTYTGNDGKIYNTICLGGREWLSENLAETRYRNGNFINIVESGWDVTTDGARCAYNNDYSLVGCGESEPTVGAITVYTLLNDPYSYRAYSMVVSQGVTPVTSRGFAYATHPEPTLADNVVYAGTGVGSMQAVLQNLQLSTTYYVRGFATNSYSTAYGQEISFTTSSGAPILTTGLAGMITSTSARVSGTIHNEGLSEISERGIVYSHAFIPTIINGLKKVSLSNEDTFTETLTSLIPDREYKYRSYAINSNGVGYGDVLTFKTKPLPTCDNPVTVSGSGMDIREVDLGSDIGTVTLSYTTSTYPIRIKIVSKSNITTGFVGHNDYDVGGSLRLQFIQDFEEFFGTNNYTLYPVDTYPRVNPMSGSLSFNKTMTGMVTIIVESMSGTNWSYTISCPQY